MLIICPSSRPKIQTPPLAPVPRRAGRWRARIVAPVLSLWLPLFAPPAVPAQSAGLQFQSPAERTALLELYTSEGCSSCPPAEAWLSGLRDSPRLWRDFAPVAFHVDYWNYLGWKDVWSDPVFTERQREFTELWHGANLYTPEFILNGKEWHNWFTGRNGPRSDGDKVGILTVTATATNRWQVVFAPETQTDARYEIHAALLAGGITSEVQAGENAGHRLNHDFVVVNLMQIGLTTSHGVARGKFILDAPRHRPGSTLALTAWVTHTGELEPLQSTGGWLIPPPKE
jgi:hypothetical protein